MKACVLEEVGRLEYKDVPEPVMKKGEVLLRIKACGICSSDIPRIFETGTYHFPTIPGHEFSGEIIDVYDEENKELIGKRAVVYPLIPCRKCSPCKEEEYARCDNYNYFGSRCDGGMAEMISVPVWNLVLFSDNLDYSSAALCEPAAVAHHAVSRSNVKAGDIVVVVGTGTVGFFEACWAKEMGAKKVIIIGRSKEKLEFSEKLGFSDTINYTASDIEKEIASLTGGTGADVCLEAVGSTEAVKIGILAVRKGGKIILTGNPVGDMLFDKTLYWKILRNELTIKGTWNSYYAKEKNDWKTTIEYMESGKLPLDKLITHKYPMEKIHDALRVLRDRNIFTVKSIINP